MKRRKRMGLCKVVPALSSRAGAGTTVVQHAHVDVATPAVQRHESVQPALESTPEKFVAFVNRMTEARSTSR